MKLLFLFAIMGLSTFSFAEISQEKTLPSSGHEIIRAYPDPELKTGQCKIKGHVYQDHNTDGPLENVMVSTLDQEFLTLTDLAGYYELTLDATDTALFAFKSEFEEHVIWNIEFQEGYVYEIDFYLSIDYSNITIDKPVIYLYSDQDISVNLRFDPVGELTFTYPVYNENTGWNVQMKDGSLMLSNKTYPYLFWESETAELDYDEDNDNDNDMIYGHYISTDTAVQFLENTLTQLGLNETESADFITYWLPKMQKKPYAFIQFMLDEDYNNNISEMSVDPKPDSARRVFMLFSSFEREQTEIDYHPQIYPAFGRCGFTLIEWGGSEITFSVTP